MKKILLPLAVIGFIIVGFLVFRPSEQKSPLSTPNQSVVSKPTLPSETSINYTDPAGFSFSYPDNLSITKQETDNNTYADLQLSSKDVSGSLSLKISDSKFKSLDDWLNLNKAATKEPVKEVKLGNLKAMEVKTSDRVFLGALDQGIFFSVEMPRVEEDFWMKVYGKLLTSFSFSAPDTTAPQAGTSAASDVSFEGEEVVQ